MLLWGYPMDYTLAFFTGAAGYSLLEMLWRGYTHWTMSLAGGVCMLVIYCINCAAPGVSVWIRCLAGAAVITVTELVFGFGVNILLGWNVWDYSSLPLNFKGQICLLYSVLWYFLCFPITWICTAISEYF